MITINKILPHHHALIANGYFSPILVVGLFFLYHATFATRDSAYHYLNSQNGIRAYTHAKSYLKECSYPIEKADALYLLGRVYYSLDSIQKSVICYKKALRRSREGGYSKLNPYLYQALALSYDKLGFREISLENYLRALSIYDSLRNKKGIADVLNSTANLYRKTGAIETSFSYYNRAIDYFIILNDSSGISSVFNNVGILLMDQNRLDSAKRLFRKNLIFHKSNPLKKSINLLNLGECFKRSNQPDSALKYLIQAYKIKKDLNAFSGLAITCNYLAEVLMVKDKNQAQQYLNEGFEISQQVGLLKEHSQNLQLQAKLFENYGQYDQSLAAFKQHKTLEDSILNQEKARALTEMQVRYETEEKERALILAEQEAKIQQVLLKEQSYAIWALSSGALLFLVIGVLAYRLYTIRNREKKQVQMHMREQHHRIENNISVMASVLSLAGQNTASEEARSLAMDGENRLNAMNLLHKELYWEEETASIRLDLFIQRLTHHLEGVFMKQIISHQLQELTIEVTRAIPICLILNELLTNAMKYGISHSNPEIVVSLEQTKKEIVLRVVDNGSGITDTHDLEGSFGMKLVHTLAKQLKGNIKLQSSEQGTEVSLRMPC